MNEALVVILALIWALVLLPGALRSRRSSPRSTVGGFEHAMDVLAHRRFQGRHLLVPGDAHRIVRGRSAHDDVLARRRRVFTVLLSATGGTFLLAVLASGVFWTLWILSAVVTGAYVGLLLRLKAQRHAAARVVRRLPRPEDAEGFRVVDESEYDRLYGRRVVGGEPGVQVATRPDDPWEQGSGVRIRRWEP